MKQTIEEAGAAYTETVTENKTSHMIGVYNGAKWQQERMYSEEEMRTAISIAYSKGLAKPNSGRLSDIPNVQNDILQQFKKK